MIIYYIIINDELIKKIFYSYLTQNKINRIIKKIRINKLNDINRL